MRCPYCNGELQENANFCAICGANLVQNRDKTDELKNPAPPQAQQTNADTYANTKKKYDKLKKSHNAEYFIAISVFWGIITIFCFLYHSFLWMFVFAGLTALFIILATVYKKKENQLAEALGGVPQTFLCPKCKSSNVEMVMVDAGTTTYNGRTTVGSNINPLRPFTYANIKQGNTYTKNKYKNICHCLNCGYICDKPLIRE